MHGPHLERMNRYIFVVVALVSAVFGSSIRHFQKVIGGTEVDIWTYQQMQYIVALLHNGKIHCGATAVSPYWALTSAHCVSDPSLISNYTLQTGIYLSTPEEVHYLVGGPVIHPEFNQSKPWENDIALVQTTTPFLSTAFLPSSQMVLGAGYPVDAYGWGVELEGEESSGRLKKLDSVIESESDCYMVYMSLGYQVTLERELCAVSALDGQGTCDGDSGGPLIYYDGVLNYVIGIESFSAGCTGFPKVYTNTFQYRDWISEQSHQ